MERVAVACPARARECVEWVPKAQPQARHRRAGGVAPESSKARRPGHGPDAARIRPSVPAGIEEPPPAWPDGGSISACAAISRRS